MKNSVRHIELLDFLRGVAIVAVLFFHTLGISFGYDALPWNGWLRSFSAPGAFLCFLPIGLLAQAGVAVFFVVSGFCIHISFQTQGKDWRSFFIRRFFRIYPPYIFALVFSFLILMINPGLDLLSIEFWKQLLTHAFLLHNFNGDTIYGANASLWSLAVEAQLYLLYPVLLALIGKAGWYRTMGILAMCEGLIRGIDGVTQTMNASDTVGGQIGWILANSPLGYWFSWALGAFIAEAWLKKEPLPFRNASSLLWLGLAFASYFIKPLYTFQFLLFAMATAAFTVRSLAGDRGNPKARAYLTDPLKKIGLWSYSIYLLHQPLLHIYSHLVVWAVPDEYRAAPVAFLLLVATWIVIIPFGVLWYRLIEISSIALGKRLQSMSVHRAGRAGAIAENPNLPATALPSTAPTAVAQPGRTTMVNYGLMTAGLLLCILGSLLIVDRFSYRTAVKNSNRAWILATSPDAAQRNGALAVSLAEDACVQTHYQVTRMVATLAAAYAEAGRFDEAVGAAQMACRLAAQSGDEKLLQKNKEMLGNFLQQKPLREQAPGTNENLPAL